MNMFRKSGLLAGICVPAFTSMSICSIDGEGEGAGGGSGGGDDSSGGEGQADGNADPDAGLTTAQKMEKEFGQEITPEDGDEDSSGEGSDQGDDSDEAGSGEDEGTDGDESDEGGDESEQQRAEAAAEPKKGRAQERIDELTAQSRTHEREAEKWREIALKHGAPANADGEGVSIPEEPDPEKYAYGEHDAEYIKDRAKYDTKIEILTEQAQANFKAEASALDAKWTKNLAGATERLPDFDEVVIKGADKWPCPPVIAIGIKDSEVGPDIAYKLAKDVPEATRISKLSPLEQAREFGKLEASFTSDKRISELEAEIAKLKGLGPDGKPKPKPNIVSKAPEPPRRRVSGGGSRGEFAADTNDFAAFERGADKILAKQK